MAEYSELLIRLMDDVVHNPSKIRARDVANLSVKELSIYMDFLDKKKHESGSEFEKHVRTQPSTVKINEIIKE